MPLAATRRCVVKLSRASPSAGVTGPEPRTRIRMQHRGFAAQPTLCLLHPVNAMTMKSRYTTETTAVIKRLILVVLLLLLMFGSIFGWKYFQGQKMAAMMAVPPPPATIASAEVRVESWQPYLYGVGSVVATQGVFVTTEVPGQVEKILFESGGQVEAGEVIMQLDDSVDEADLEGLIAQQRLARLQFERARKLLKDRSVSQSEFDQSRAQLDSATATVASKRAVIAKKKIRAPFSGQLGIRQVDVGEYLSPGDNIVPLQALDPVFVDYTLPERHFEQLRVGQAVRVEVQAYPGRVFDAPSRPSTRA